MGISLNLTDVLQSRLCDIEPYAFFQIFFLSSHLPWHIDKMILNAHIDLIRSEDTNEKF